MSEPMHKNTYLVTGASSALGLDVCKALRAKMAHIVAVDADAAHLGKTLQSEEIEVVQCWGWDFLHRPPSPKIREWLNPIKGVIHCGMHGRKLDALLKDQEDAFLAKIMTNTLLLSRICREKLLPGGKVVFVSCLESGQNRFNKVFYRELLSAFVKALAEEGKERKIHATALSIRTPPDSCNAALADYKHAVSLILDVLEGRIYEEKIVFTPAFQSQHISLDAQ